MSELLKAWIFEILRFFEFRVVYFRISFIRFRFPHVETLICFQLLNLRFGILNDILKGWFLENVHREMMSIPVIKSTKSWI